MIICLLFQIFWSLFLYGLMDWIFENIHKYIHSVRDVGSIIKVGNRWVEGHLGRVSGTWNWVLFLGGKTLNEATNILHYETGSILPQCLNVNRLGGPGACSSGKFWNLNLLKSTEKFIFLFIFASSKFSRRWGTPLSSSSYIHNFSYLQIVSHLA